MPVIPEPKGAAPDLMPFLRWVRDTLSEMIVDRVRQSQADSNTNLSQNSTMSTLVDRLGSVEAMMATISSGLTLDAAQIVSGVLNIARIPDLDGSKLVSGSINLPGSATFVGNGTFNAAWTNLLSVGSRQSVWMNASGMLGYAPSTERVKKDIQAWSPEEQAVLAMELVQFRYIEDDGHIEVGLIAERLHELGLEWLVAYDVDDVPISIHYDRIALALLPTVQRLRSDVDDLRERVTLLEK